MSDIAKPLTSEFSHGTTRAIDYAADIGSSYHRSRIYIAARLLERHVNVRGLRAFDFGCGEGAFMRWLKTRGADVSGCDPSPVLVAKAEGAIRGGVSVLLNIAAVEIVCALHVLSYLSREEQAMFWRGVGSVISPGGYLLFTNSNMPTPRNANDITPSRDVRSFLYKYGFEEIARDYIGYYPRIFRWSMLYRPLGFGWKRAGRVYHPWRLRLVPNRWLANRSVGYYVLARKL